MNADPGSAGPKGGGRPALSVSELHEIVRREHQTDADRIWQVRAWGVGVVSAVLGGLLLILVKGDVAAGAPLGNPYWAAITLIVVGALLNGGLWVVTQRLAWMSSRRGAYLWYLEHKAGLRDGWEQLVYALEVRKKRRWSSNLTDIHSWVGALLTLLACPMAYLAPGSSLKWGVLAIPFGIWVGGALRRSVSHHRRETALREVLECLRGPGADLRKDLIPYVPEPLGVTIEGLVGGGSSPDERDDSAIA